MTERDIASIVLELRILLAGVFLFAGVLKVNRTAPDTVRMLEAAGMPFRSTLPGLVRVLPVVEILVGVALLSSQLVIGALIAVTCLLATFCGVMAMAIRAGYDGGCGCFGQRKTRNVSTIDVLFNVCLCLIAAYALVAVLVHPSTMVLSITALRTIDVLSAGLLLSWVIVIFGLLQEVQAVLHLLQPEKV